MFGKLMKHEFQATGRSLLRLYGIMLVLALMTTMAMRLFDLNQGWQGSVVGYIMIAYGLSIFAVAVGVFIILTLHYKKNILGDEGYLMMTLPTGVHSLLLSKLLTAMAWYLLTGVAMVLSVLIADSSSIDSAFFHDLVAGLHHIFSQSGALSVLLRVLLAMLLFASLITLLSYAYYSLEQSFRKHKGLYNFAAVVVTLVLFRLCGWISVNYHINAGLAAREVQILTPIDYAQLIGLNLLMYFAAWWALSKRLNLE